MSRWIEEILCNQKIIGVRVKSPSAWLKVDGGGWIEVNIKGDCCSEAFIDAIRLEGSPKLTGKYQEIAFSAKPSAQESDEVTAVRFDGDSAFGTGSLVIVHRNSSNGYYGNYLSVNNRGEPPLDAVAGEDWYRV